MPGIAIFRKERYDYTADRRGLRLVRGGCPSTMNDLVRITQEKFGDDAPRLLDAHAIIPINNKQNRKAASKDWTQGHDPFTKVQFHSLALMTGPRSGITVWDFDSHDIEAPVSPNVLTAHGCHIYTKHAGEPRKIRYAPDVDLLGQNSYAVFHSEDRQFVHPALADSQVISNWMNENFDTPLLQGIKEGYNKGSDEGSNEGIDEGYYNQMLGLGFPLDREAIERGYVALMRTRAVGTRNNSLYLYSRELIRCGISTKTIAEAAFDAGLDEYEINATISSAGADIGMGTSMSVYDRVQIWRDTAWPGLPAYATPVLEFIAKRAIVLNDLSPFIVQEEIVTALREAGVERSQQAVSKTVVSLDKVYGVLKVVQLGYMPDGRRKPNAYRLCIDGQPVSELVGRLRPAVAVDGAVA